MHQVAMEDDDGKVQELIARMLDGDPRCPIALGSRIEKINSEPGDTVADGHPGYVRGSAYVDKVGDCLYLVEWDGIDVPKMQGVEATVPYIAIAGYRIREMSAERLN